MEDISSVQVRNHKGRQSMSFESTDVRRVTEVASLVNVRETREMWTMMRHICNVYRLKQ